MSMVVDVPDWLQKYHDRGFQLVFYNTKSKGPKDKGWPSKPYPIESYQPGQNVGVKLGVEIEPEKFLLDVDFDYPEGLIFAKYLIPPTGFGFGRGEKKITHSFFTTSQPVPSYEFNDVDGKPLVEIRGLKKDGINVGLQTMLPPSIHPDPPHEQITLAMDEAITHDDEVPNRVRLYAIACLVYRHLAQHQGLFHESRLALAGFLLKLGVREEDCILLGQAIAAVTGNSQSDIVTTVKSTAARIKANEKVEGRTKLAKLIGEENGKKVVALIHSWIGTVDSDFICNSAGLPYPNNTGNILKALEKLEIGLRYDDFFSKPMCQFNGSGGEYDDAMQLKIWFEIEERYNFRPTPDLFERVVRNQSYKNRFNPARDYFESLTWDGIERLETWLIRHAKVELNPEIPQHEAYIRAVSRMPLIAAVRRVYHKNVKFDEMLILESDQGMNKSSALRLLCPHDDWFTDDLPLNIDAKQIMERTEGKLIIEASELSGFNKRGVEHLKSMLSRWKDGPARMSYDRLPSTRSRQFVIIGTTNAHTYLTDETGNRRFWPVRVGQFDLVSLKEERDQIWAEAVWCEKKGVSIRLDPALYDMARLQQERRRILDPWEIRLGTYIPTPGPAVRVTTLKILEGILHLQSSQQDHRASQRIGNIMKNFGCRYTNISSSEKGWVRDASPGFEKEAIIRDKNIGDMLPSEDGDM